MTKERGGEKPMDFRRRSEEEHVFWKDGEVRLDRLMGQLMKDYQAIQEERFKAERASDAVANYGNFEKGTASEEGPFASDYRLKKLHQLEELEAAVTNFRIN